MGTSRLEAFTDGVIAILITIMVLDLKVPHEPTWAALKPQVPILVTYALSFVFVGIYWNNHHHMFHLVKRVTGGILWANLNLLFWLSLIPFTTGWMGENRFDALPTAVYGAVLLAAALSYTLLQVVIVRHPEAGAPLAAAVGRDLKGKLSVAAYVVAIPCAFLHQWIADGLYIAVAAMWLIPDRRIESRAQTGAR